MNDAYDPRTWPLDVNTARAIYREDRERQHKAEARRARGLYTFQFAKLVESAIAGGAVRKGDGQFWEWDVSHGCLNPGHIRHFNSGMQGTVEMIIPCRTQCANCLKVRSSIWTARALTEAHRCNRTWLATLTLAPEQLYAAEATARLRHDHAFSLARVSRGDFRNRRTRFVECEWGDLTPGDQFGLTVSVAGEAITTWLKRVRKRCLEEWLLQGHGTFDKERDRWAIPDSAIRYLLVVEKHKSGAPHWHLLVHERYPELQIRYDWLKLQPRKPRITEWWMPPQIDARWDLGFSSFKLKPAKLAPYVTKYIAKSLLARVRASKRYGERTPSGNDLTPHNETRGGPLGSKPNGPPTLF